MEKEKLLENIDIHLKMLPWYVREYYQAQMTIPRSFRTMFEYLKEYRRFFEWLIAEKYDTVDQKSYRYVDVDEISNIDISELEHLPKKVVEEFFVYLRTYKTDKKTGEVIYRDKPISEVTISRTRMALSSLFNYLTKQTENDEGEPYFYRNVMDKILSKNTTTKTINARAASIEPMLLLGEKTQEFLEYIDCEYPSKCSPRALVSYKKNRERDLAICALLLASGIRLSEAVNANVKDLNINNMTIDVIRKGGTADHVNIASFAKPYLVQYLNIRKTRYQTTDVDNALFITTQSNAPQRLGGAAIERMVAKYSSGFNVRITPHKMRHTLATRLYSSTNDMLITANQLGHKGTEMVSVYAHITSDKTKDILDEF